MTDIDYYPLDKTTKGVAQRLFGASANDWLYAFEYSDTFTMHDVAEVVAKDDGENDGADWIGVFRLQDGRFAYLHAGCDYTGWDCQASGDAHVCDTLDELLRGFVGEENCRRLKLPVPS